MQAKELSTDALLYTGDALALVLLTVAGFATHGELSTAGTRMLSTYVPLAVAWALTAPWLGLYREATVRDARQLWRPVWAAVLATPLAALLRSLWLGEGIVLPIFVLALGATTAGVMLLWRTVWLLVRRR